MATKVKLEICTGTACYLMGGADLLMLAAQLPPELHDRLELVGRACMDNCRRPECGKTPFVVIDGELVAAATQEKVRELILARLAGRK